MKLAGAAMLPALVLLLLVAGSIGQTQEQCLTENDNNQDCKGCCDCSTDLNCVAEMRTCRDTCATTFPARRRLLEDRFLSHERRSLQDFSSCTCKASEGECKDCCDCLDLSECGSKGSCRDACLAATYTGEDTCDATTTEDSSTTTTDTTTTTTTTADDASAADTTTADGDSTDTTDTTTTTTDTTATTTDTTTTETNTSTTGMSDTSSTTTTTGTTTTTTTPTTGTSSGSHATPAIAVLLSFIVALA